MSRLVLFTGSDKFYGSEVILANLISYPELQIVFSKIILITSDISEITTDFDKIIGDSGLQNTIEYIKLDFKNPRKINKRNYYKIFWPILFIYIFLEKYALIVFNYFKIKRNISIFQTDIVFINNGGFPGSLTAFSFLFHLKIKNPKRIFYMVNNLARNYRSPLRFLDKILDLVLLKNIKFITGSNSARDRLMTVLGNNNNVFSIHTGTRDLYQDKSFKSELKLEEDVFYFFCGAIFQHRKGHDVLIDAFSKFKKVSGHEKVVLILAGEGECQENIKKKVQMSSLSNSVLFIGHVKNISEYLNSVDCLILPSLSDEDFPNIIMESMSCALPVIATKIAGIPEQINQGCGILCEPGSLEDLFQAMMKLYTDRETLKIMGLNARARFLMKFKKEISMANYLDYIKK